MGAMGNYLANAMLNRVLRGVALPDFGIYVALHVSDPGPTGNPATEVAGGSYERINLPRNVSSWTSPSNKTSANSTQLVWDDMPGAVVSYLGIWTAKTGGNLLFYGNIDDRAVFEGGSFTIEIEDLAIILQ